MKEQEKNKVKNEDELSSKLMSLKNLSPFSTPENFFEELENKILSKTIESKEAVSKPSHYYWLKITLASSVAAAILFIGYFFYTPEIPNNHPINIAIKNGQTTHQSLDSSNNKFSSEKMTQEQVAQQEYDNINKINGKEIDKIDNQKQLINPDYQTPQNQNKKVDKAIVQIKQNIDNNNSNPIFYNNNSVNNSQVIATNSSNSINTTARLSNSSTIITGFLGADTCSPNSILLDATKKNMRCTYLWSNGSHNSSILAERNGKYWVKIFTSDNEIYGLDTIEVKIFKIEKPNLGSDQMICSSENILIDSKLDNDEYSYIWNITTNKQSKTELNNLSPGIYKIRLDISYCGQSSFDEMILKVNDCALKFPNVITPNGDGLNDIFVIQGLENFPGSSLFIMDRSGKTIYENHDYQNNWSADDIPAGTYFYLLRRNDSKKTEDGGVITVVR